MQISERANPIKTATGERAGGPVTTAVDEDDVTTVASSDSSVKANKPTARRSLELSRASEKHDPKATKSAAKSGRKTNVETSGDERRADDARESGSKKGKGARKRVPRMTRLNPEVNSMLEEMAAFHGIDINATISVAITMYYRHIFHSRESAPRAGEWPSR